MKSRAKGTVDTVDVGKSHSEKLRRFDTSSNN
jgi:hypothetical protein